MVVVMTRKRKGQTISTIQLDIVKEKKKDLFIVFFCIYNIVMKQKRKEEYTNRRTLQII